MKYVFMRFPGGKFKAVTFSYDDGSCYDRRLADLFESYGVRATFNLCSSMLKRAGETGNISADEAKSFISRGFEIANHGEKHMALGVSDHTRGIAEVLNCRTSLEEMLGCIIRGFAYPDTMKYISGENYLRIKSYLQGLGIAYARLGGGDNDSFDIPDDFYAWYPTAHHNNPALDDYITKFLDINEEKLYRASKYPRLMYIWGHSAEFNSRNNWDRMENILSRLSGKEDVWYATNIEIVEYIEAYRRLVTSANGELVYNPTLKTLWMNVDGKTVSVEPGETVNIG